MIESITLPVTAFNPKKWKKFVSARHWFSVEGLPDETLSITYWSKPHLGGTFSAFVIQFPHGKGYPVTARPMTRKEKERYNRWKRR